MKKRFMLILSGIMLYELLCFSGYSYAKKGKWTKKADAPSMYKIYKINLDGGNPIPITGGGCKDPSWFDLDFAKTVEPAGKLANTWGKIKGR